MALRPKSTRTYNTRANKKERMYQFEKEIHELREEVTTLPGELEKLSTLVASLAVAQNPPQFQQKPQQPFQQRNQQQPRQ